MPSMALPSSADQPSRNEHALPGGTLSDTCYAYCYDRGNGQYTRLIPADLLPPLQDIPAIQQGCQGMIVLREPPASAPDGRSANNRTTGVESVQLQSPTSDIIQVRHPPSFCVIVSQPVIPASDVPKKAKVYCDNWVHYGACAFTQQGCKYKHEMPHDRETQLSLGLFNGLPSWYKSLLNRSPRLRSHDLSSDQALTQCVAPPPVENGHCRQNSALDTKIPAQNTHAGVRIVQKQTQAQHQQQWRKCTDRRRSSGQRYWDGGWGPIAPPRTASNAKTPIISQNPFSKLSMDNTWDDSVEEGEDETIDAV